MQCPISLNKLLLISGHSLQVILWLWWNRWRDWEQFIIFIQHHLGSFFSFIFVSSVIPLLTHGLSYSCRYFEYYVSFSFNSWFIFRNIVSNISNKLLISDTSSFLLAEMHQNYLIVSLTHQSESIFSVAFLQDLRCEYLKKHPTMGLPFESGQTRITKNMWLFSYK
jgi:hypothetical protein